MGLADVIAFATPIYYYEMSGQMKTLIDRSNPLFTSDYNFRDIYLIAACADDSESAVEGATKGLQGWIDCFEKCSLKGVVLGKGADEAGSVKETKAVLKAYEMGLSVK